MVIDKPQLISGGAFDIALSDNISVDTCGNARFIIKGFGIYFKAVRTLNVRRTCYAGELNHHRLEAGGFDWRLEAA